MSGSKGLVASAESTQDLTPTDEAESPRLETLHANASRHEAFWIKRIADSEPFVLSHAQRAEQNEFTDSSCPPEHTDHADYVDHTAKRCASISAHESLTAPIASEARASLAARYPTRNPGDLLLATLVRFLARFSQSDAGDIGYTNETLLSAVAGVEEVFSPLVPLRVEIDPESGLDQAVDACVHETHQLDILGPYQHDLLVRHSCLNHAIDREWPVTVCRVASLAGFTIKPATDLTLIIPDDGQAIRWTGNTHTLPDGRFCRMPEQFALFLQAAGKDPDRATATLPLLSAPQLERLLVTWNDTARDYPLEKCLHELVEEQVQRTPNAVAVQYAEQQLSFRELNRQANQLAHYLMEQGVGAGICVGLCMERSLELTISVCAVLKAGGAFVPLDPEYPTERIAFMLEDAAVSMVLVQEPLLPVLPVQAATVFCVDTQWPAIASRSVDNPRATVNPADPAYVIFTSGSTGRPKGAMNSHRGICNRLLCMQERWPLDANDRILQKTPFIFDPSIWELFCPLMTGARLIMARTGGHKEPKYLVDMVQAHGITVLDFVPSMLRQCLDTPGMDQCASLKRIICGGEALSMELQNRCFEVLDGIELCNAYGPSEAAIDVVNWTCEPGGEGPMVPIGYPVANTQLYILDERRQPVPVGVPGELYIGGLAVGMGYVNRPEQTQERFIVDPFSAQAEARLYRTGDLTRYRSDGAVEFLGRVDTQVKLRGMRIELAEIETVLLSHGEISEAVVTMTEEGARQRLVGYYVSSIELEPQSLRTHLLQALPEYMVPAILMKLESLPLTPSGKVDRRSLPDPHNSAIADESCHVAPRTLTEKVMTEVWEKVLERRRLGVNDDFFELGGDSLLALVLMLEVENRFGVEMPLQVLFEATTVASFATRLDMIAGTPASGADLSATDAPGEKPLTQTECRLQDIWQRLLGRRQIGIHENFFELQGSPDRMDEMLDEARSTFGVYTEGLPVQEFVAEPTIETLARIIDTSIEQTSRSLIVCLQPKGEKPPLFLIHGAGGYVFFYRALVSHLRDDRPVYAIRAETPADESGRPFESNPSIEAIARQYVAEIKSAHPEGPYAIGGASMGGVIAYEVAKQLREAGDEIAEPLLIFDGAVHNNPNLLSGEEYDLFSKAGIFIPESMIAGLRRRTTASLQQASQLGLARGLGLMTLKALRNIPSELTLAAQAAARYPCRLRRLMTCRFNRGVKPCKNAGKVVAGSVEELQRSFMQDSMNASTQLLFDYTPGECAERLVVFKAIDNPIDVKRTWAGLTRGGIVEYEVPGNHLEMMEEPMVARTASLVRQCLR